MKWILVVDDERPIAGILAEFLEDVGYGVRTAANGREALEQIGKTHPALVICDLMMPVMDGQDLCRALRRTASTRHVPIVLMSAASYAAQAGDCDYAAFIPKPFRLDTILDTISAIIGPP